MTIEGKRRNFIKDNIPTAARWIKTSPSRKKQSQRRHATGSSADLEKTVNLNETC